MENKYNLRLIKEGLIYFKLKLFFCRFLFIPTGLFYYRGFCNFYKNEHNDYFFTEDILSQFYQGDKPRGVYWYDRKTIRGIKDRIELLERAKIYYKHLIEMEEGDNMKYPCSRY